MTYIGRNQIIDYMMVGVRYYTWVQGKIRGEALGHIWVVGMVLWVYTHVIFS